MAAALLPLSGCLFSGTVDELYQLPQLPAEYTELQRLLDSILDSGAEYAAPTAGTNLQSVQLVDLNGDGSQEAVAFFRSPNEERPLRIYIFEAASGSYRQAALIEGSGTAVHSIQYEDMDGDGTEELLVGWRVSPELQALSVYSIRNFEPRSLITTNYVRFSAADLDGDGRQELAVLRGDGEENVADYYGWQPDGALVLQSTTRLSMTMAELRDAAVGTLADGSPALFITGVAEETRAITDILAWREGGLTNLMVNPTTGVTSEIFRYVGLEPMDINEDGITEVPMPALLPAVGGEADWKIYWRSYSAEGQAEEVCLTYHNVEEEWFLLLPEAWDNRIVVSTASAAGGEERITTFGYSRQGTYVDFLRIYTITGANRESRASLSGRFILVRQAGSVIYAASFTEEGRAWYYNIAEEELRARFRVIPAEWSAEIS